MNQAQKWSYILHYFVTNRQQKSEQGTDRCAITREHQNISTSCELPSMQSCPLPLIGNSIFGEKNGHPKIKGNKPLRSAAAGPPHAAVHWGGEHHPYWVSKQTAPLPHLSPVYIRGACICTLRKEPTEKCEINKQWFGKAASIAGNTHTHTHTHAVTCSYVLAGL